MSGNKLIKTKLRNSKTPEISEDGKSVAIGNFVYSEQHTGIRIRVPERRPKSATADPVIRELGFRLLIPVHDELLGECPIENVDKVEQRLSELMIAAAKPECSVNMKVDTYAVKHWYADEVYNSIRDKYIHQVKDGMSEDLSLQHLCADYPELDKHVVESMCAGTYDVLSEL